MSRIAGIELGGTKGFALVAHDAEIIDSLRVTTTTPHETLSALSDWLHTRHKALAFDALGIASFGPLGLDRAKADYGYITKTTKPGWSDSDVVGTVRRWFGGPIGFDTDVAGAALAEQRWGAAQGTAVSSYLTIGTGIGGGLLVDGVPVHGLVHPEMGHVRVRRRAGDDFAGICPFHKDCLEGLASGPAIKARTGHAAEDLPDDHPVWTDVAAEIAELLVSLIMIASPHKILIGGGVGIGKPFLFAMIRDAVAARLQNYVVGVDRAALDALIQPPALGERAGPLGAIALGLSAAA